MTNKKILILYTSIGLGHKSIAENMAYYLEQAGYHVKLADILKVQSGLVVKLGTVLHGFVNRRLPFVWSWMYQSQLVTKLVKALRSRVASGNNSETINLLQEYQPDMVLTTQATASGVIASLKQQKKFHGKFVIGFSDYHLHPLWLYDEVDYYLANTTEQKNEMIKLGVAENIISVCGITLKPAEPIDTASVKQRLGVSQQKIVLVLSGSLGIGLSAGTVIQTAQSMAEIDSSIITAVVCGKNKVLYNQLQKIQSPYLKVLGYYQPIAELYQVADEIITKPGGLSIAEMLQVGKKPLITHWLPGQEELNYGYLVRHKLVHPKPQPADSYSIASSVVTLLKSGRPQDSAEMPEIILKSKDGKVLIEAINKVFHGV